LLLISKRLREQPKLVLAAAAIGWASHGPLDALTSYGTMLWWPLSYQRVSLDWMPIIDPIWTLTMLALVLAAVFRKRVRWTRTSIAFCTIYFGFAAWQHGRALDATAAVAASRGHVPQNLRAMPSPTALSLWRGLYRTSDHAHAVGVFVPYLVGQPRVNPGPRALLADVGTAADSAEERRMFEVFNWFADGFAFVPDPSQPGRVADGRYSADAAGFASLWGLDLASDPPRRWSPDADFDAGRIVRATFGRDAEYRVLPED
jgi:inner membrane protein